MNKKLHILIIEDSEEETESLLSALRQSDYDPIHERVEDAEAMEVALTRQLWDIVLSNYIMPRFSALAALELLKKNEFDIPFIIVSSNADEAAVAAVIKAGAYDFVQKGQHAHLTASIERELQKAQKRQAHQAAQQLLLDQEKYFRALIENTSDAIITLDNSGAIIYASPAITRILGYTTAEFLDLNMFDLAHPDEVEMGKEFSKELLQEPGSVNMAQFRVKHKNGSWRWLEITGRNLVEELTPNTIVFNLHDITDHKLATAAIQASQQLAQSTIDSLSSHICVLDETGTVMAVNKSWIEFARANGGDLSTVGIGTNYFTVCDRVYGQDRLQAERFAKGIQAVIEGESDRFEMEYPCHSPDEKRWFVGRITPFQTMDIASRWVVAAHENITMPRLAEEHLRLQSAALEAAANAIVITDTTSKIEWVNPAFSALTGYTKQEAIGRKPNELIKSGKHDKQFYKALWDTVLAGEVWHGELVNRHKDGSFYSEEQTITPLIDSDGIITHFIAIKMDVTERKQIEDERSRLLEQVQEQAQHIKEIMKTAPVGVVLFDAEGNVLLANPLAEVNLEILAAYQTGQPVTHLAERPIQHYFAPPQHGGPWHEASIGEKTFELFSKPIKLREEKQWVMMIQDVTQQREYQRFFQAQEQMAIVGQLAAGIAHDFNNIMGVISIYSEMLMDGPSLSDKQQRQIKTIYEQSQYAVSLIQQIMDFSRRSLLEKIQFDLVPIMKELVKMLERTLPSNIKSNLQYSDKEFILFGDPTRMQQVLINLALNARDAMPSGGKLNFILESLVAEVENQPLPNMVPGKWLKLSVSDTGEGIAPEVVDHIFEPFFTTKSPGKGTGLGLSQVFGIVKLHEGFITVETTVDLGTVFTIYLPRLESLQVVHNKRVESTALPLGTETILLVEDNLAVQDSLVEALSRLEYNVLTANNGAEAMVLLSKQHLNIDLVVTDWIMPEMDGATLKHQINQNYPEMKLMYVTGSPISTGTDIRLPEINISWLVKPFDLATLAYNLRLVLDGSNETDKESDSKLEEPTVETGRRLSGNSRKIEEGGAK